MSDEEVEGIFTLIGRNSVYSGGHSSFSNVKGPNRGETPPPLPEV